MFPLGFHATRSLLSVRIIRIESDECVLQLLEEFWRVGLIDCRTVIFFPVTFRTASGTQAVQDWTDQNRIKLEWGDGELEESWPDEWHSVEHRKYDQYTDWEERYAAKLHAVEQEK